jgi:hypothetical protein
MEQPISAGAQLPASESREVAHERTKRRFFVSMAAVLLVIVAVGFAPSFYMPGVLRPHAAAAGKLDFPFYIVLHGIVLSLWYLLLFTQALLIATKRTPIHRKLGIAGAALAAVLVPLGLFVVTRSVARSNLGALPVLGDYALLTLFAIMVTLAIRHRGKPDVHKRLVLMASISIVAPALARWPGAEALVPISVIGPQLALFAAIMGHDFVTRRRVHRVTGWGTAAYFVAVGVTVPLASSEFGRQLVNSLK